MEKSRWEVREENVMVEFQVLTGRGAQKGLEVSEGRDKPHPAESSLHLTAYLIVHGGFHLPSTEVIL